MRKKAVLWGICFFLQMSFITWGITLSAILRRLSILPKISRHFNHGKHGKHGKQSTRYQAQYLRKFIARYLSVSLSLCHSVTLSSSHPVTLSTLTNFSLINR